MQKPKVVNYELIADLQSEPYRLLDEVRDQWHEETIAAKVALAWRNHTNMDVDGHLVLGKCVRVADLHKEFAEFDFIIVLNREVWDDKRFSREKKLALLDHEMCHAAIAVDSEGEPVVDERKRRVYRSRKHDIEEFREVVARHGCYKQDLERFADALLKKHANPLFDEEPSATETEALAGDKNPEDSAEFEAQVRRSMGVPKTNPQGTRLESVRPRKSGPRELAAYHTNEANKAQKPGRRAPIN